ncbi:hypothetical protein [Xenorhabdus bharatensis]|uniref:hypothetical protein n=1 Tax=Xenorhabdus bharatensis TaxID=3136256 RepID=UPI0030F3DF22
MESCSGNDEGWMYCRNNKPISVEEALETKILVIKRITRALKKQADLRKACGGKQYTGLDESIYYDRCGNLMSADEVFEKNVWVKGTEDLFVNTYHGINRTSDTISEYNPSNIVVRSIMEKRISVNPLILKENAEAIYLLTRALDPYGFLTEAAEVILSSILDDISGQRKELLTILLLGKGLIKENKKTTELMKFTEGKINTAVIDVKIKLASNMVTNNIIRSAIVSAVVHSIVHFVATKNPLFIRKRAGIIKRANIFVVFASNYGIIEKLSKSARWLKINHPKVYERLDKVRLTLSYHFFEDVFGDILRLSEHNKNSSSDQDFVRAIEKLLDKYAN